MRHAIEYAVLRVAVFGVDLLPLAAAGWVARRFADVVFVFDRSRREVAIDNILRAGLEQEPSRARELARRSAGHFAVVIVETLKASKMLAGNRWRDKVSFVMPPEVKEVLDDPERGILVTTGHFGNWEIGAQAVSRLKPLVAAARKVSNPHVDTLLQRRKPSRGFRLVPEWFGSPTRYTEALRNGEALAILIDLDARGEGIKLDFFGRPAATHVTAAMLHLVTKAPLVFASCRRLETGRFELEISGLIEHGPTGDKQADVREILSRLNAELERAIRRHPEQYLWAHSRWKYGEWVPPPGFVPVSGRLGRVDRLS